MKRLLLLSTLTLLLVLIIGSSAFATLGRIRSLGNADYYFKDISHIYVNPAFLGQYTNTVYAELGSYYDWMDEYDTPYDQTLGINYKVYKGLSLGLTLNRYEDWIAGYFIPHDEEFDFPYPINGYDILASYDFEKLHIGVSFYHAGNKDEGSSRYTNEDTLTGSEDYETYLSEYEASSGISSLTGGFVFDLDENKTIEGMVKLSFDRAKYTSLYTDTGFYSWGYNWNEYEDRSYETDGGTRIEFGARAFWGVSENFQVVPLFAFGTESISLDSSVIDYYRNSDFGVIRADTGKGSTGDYKESYFLIGLGGNLKLDKGMVVGGLNLTRYKWTDELDTISTHESTEWFMPGFNLGVEYELTKWLTARVGMEKWFGRDEYKSEYDYWYPSPPDPDSFRYHWTSLYEYKDRFSNNPEDFIGLGVGFKFSKFKVDATVGEQNLFQGGYILSGKERNMFGILSATFEF